jgi:hypothetical protein
MKCKRIAAGTALAGVIVVHATLSAADGPADPGAATASAASYSDVFSGYRTFVSESGDVASPDSGLAPAGHPMLGMHNVPGTGDMKGMKGMSNMENMDEMKGMQSGSTGSNTSEKSRMKNMPEMENMPGMDHGRMQHMQH